MDVQQLVALAVPVELVRRHRLGGQDDAHHHVAVHEQRHAARDGVPARSEAAGLHEVVAVGVLVGALDLDPPHGSTL